MTLATGSAVVLVAAISLADFISPFLEPGSREARRAQDHYRNQEWVEAIEELQSAVAEQDDPRLSYNLGAASYKAQNYPEAAKAYSATVESEDIDPARIAYDQGNVLHKSGELEAALEAYRTALRSDPEDEDARFNYELTLRQLQQGEQEEQEQEPGDQGENEEQDSDAPQDSTGQSQQQEQEQQEGEGEEQPEDQQDDGEQGEDQQQGSGGEEDQPPPQDGEGAERQEGQLLSPEEAKRLLNAIAPEERELIKARLQSSKRRKVEKDW
jgi:Ca-activated chloride channel family protein